MVLGGGDIAKATPYIIHTTDRPINEIRLIKVFLNKIPKSLSAPKKIKINPSV